MTGHRRASFTCAVAEGARVVRNSRPSIPLAQEKHLLEYQLHACAALVRYITPYSHPFDPLQACTASHPTPSTRRATLQPQPQPQPPAAKVCVDPSRVGVRGLRPRRAAAAKPSGWERPRPRPLQSTPPRRAPLSAGRVGSFLPPSSAHPFSSPLHLNPRPPPYTSSTQLAPEEQVQAASGAPAVPHLLLPTTLLPPPVGRRAGPSQQTPPPPPPSPELRRRRGGSVRRRDSENSVARARLIDPSPDPPSLEALVNSLPGWLRRPPARNPASARQPARYRKGKGSSSTRLSRPPQGGGSTTARGRTTTPTSSSSS